MLCVEPGQPATTKIRAPFGGLLLGAGRTELELAVLIFVAPPAAPSHRQSHSRGSYNVWAELLHLQERLVGLQQELSREPELEPSQRSPNSHVKVTNS